MKSTLIGMAILLIFVAGLALWRGTETFSLGLRTSGGQMLRFLPILIVALLLAGFTEVLLPAELVERWLSDSAGWRGIMIAWVAGILTPGGSVMGMPLIAALFNVGTGIGVLVTYMTSLALMSLLRVPLEVGFYGWRLTLLRIAATIIMPPIAGIIAQIIAPLFLEK